MVTSVALGALGLLGLYYVWQVNMPSGVNESTQLRVLGLSFNQLAEPPDVRENTHLEVLNLSSNQLTEPPDVRENTHLEVLDLSSNQLTEPPDVRENTQLRELNVFHNQLTAPPDVRENTHLEVLDLSFNQLTAPPDVSGNTWLRILVLTGNQLTAPPNVSRNTQLRELHVFHNQLTEPPDVSGNIHLEVLNLSNNRLTYLPDSILFLPRNCQVRVENNHFSADYVQAFMQRLQAHRALHPDQGPSVTFSVHDYEPATNPLSLSDELDFWNREIERVGGTRVNPFALDEDHQNKLLAEYLYRLRQTKDYAIEGAARDNVVLRVNSILQRAGENEEYKQAMLALIQEGLETCGDRVSIIFNDLEILSQFYGNLNREEYRDLAIRAERYERLKQHAMQVVREKELTDQIETILYYSIQLKHVLNLPITASDMLYPFLSDVTQKMLDKAKVMIRGLSDEELLQGSGYWREYLKKQHSKEAALIQEGYGNLLERAEEYFTSDNRDTYLELHPEVLDLLCEVDKRGYSREYAEVANCIRELCNQELANLDKV